DLGRVSGLDLGWIFGLVPGLDLGRIPGLDPGGVFGLVLDHRLWHYRFRLVDLGSRLIRREVAAKWRAGKRNGVPVGHGLIFRRWNVDPDLQIGLQPVDDRGADLQTHAGPRPGALDRERLPFVSGSLPPIRTEIDARRPARAGQYERH